MLDCTHIVRYVLGRSLESRSPLESKFRPVPCMSCGDYTLAVMDQGDLLLKGQLRNYGLLLPW